MDDNKWHWQEPEKAWKGVGIYHVTLTISSREPLLGSLVTPNDDPKQAFVERTELGKNVIHALAQIPVRSPEIRLLQYCLMPDHVHAVLYVTRSMRQSIRTVVRGWWQGVKKLGREYVLSIDPNTIRNNEQNFPLDNQQSLSPLFVEMPFIRPMSRRGQLDTMMQYVKMNPQRLATKRLMPGFFRVQTHIELAGRIYSGVGNTKLLLADRFEPVHVRFKMETAARQGDTQALRDYMNNCVLAARQGAVMVSPFISEKEKEVMVALLAEEHPFILLADNGFNEYYKPSAGIFDAVAAGRVLILSPWEYDPEKKHISRDDCTALNGMAEEIANVTI